MRIPLSLYPITSPWILGCSLSFNHPSKDFLEPMWKPIDLVFTGHTQRTLDLVVLTCLILLCVLSTGLLIPLSVLV